MSGLINVNGSDDPSYRYKMPRLVGKIEGRGNGIKTVIVNCSDIAQSLHRPSGQVTKFFGCELGAMSKYEKKIDRSLVNGAFETSDLQGILTKYIEKFVLCPSCRNPETVMEVKGKKKDAAVWLNCKACGNVAEADNTHKLCTYIHKQMGGPSKGLSKEERKRRKAEKKASENGDEEEEEGEEEDADKKEKKKKKNKKKKSSKDSMDDSDKERRRRKKEKKRKEKERERAEAENVDNPEDAESSDTDDDFAPVSLSNLTVHDVASIDSAVTSLQAIIERESPDNARIVEEASKLQVACALAAKDRNVVLFFAIVCEQSGNSIKSKMGCLSGLTTTREEQIEMLACLEESVVRAEAAKKESALEVIPMILMQLYEQDVVDEELIHEWFEGKLKPEHPRCVVPDEVVTQIKEKAKVIVEWLKEAESEEESGEE